MLSLEARRKKARRKAKKALVDLIIAARVAVEAEDDYDRLLREKDK